MYTVSEAWIHRFKTLRGGWTQKQLAALGVSWPPVKGWIRRVVGRQIHDTQRRAFEQDSGIRVRRRLGQSLPF